MADFSELCPLFATGVFHEVVFPRIALSTVSISANLLVGTEEGIVRSAMFTFGRTIVVTGCYVKRCTTVNSIETMLEMAHRTTQLAIGTVFGSLTLPITESAHQVNYQWAPMVVTAKTFTSDEVLSFGTNSKVSSGAVALMVRYREK